jgi:hypothetical protein
MHLWSYYYYLQLVSRSVRLGLEFLIVTHSHIFFYLGIKFRYCLSWGVPPTGGRGCHVQGSRSLSVLYAHTHVWNIDLLSTELGYVTVAILLHMRELTN